MHNPFIAYNVYINAIIVSSYDVHEIGNSNETTFVMCVNDKDRQLRNEAVDLHK